VTQLGHRCIAASVASGFTLSPRRRIWDEALQQNVVIDLLSKQAPNATDFVVFDACRNELNVTGLTKKGLGTQKGFVPLQQTAGLLIAYVAMARLVSSR
jgi:hypothetical protein